MAKNDAWLALTTEETLEPELVICDPHHHLWRNRTERVAPDYLLDEMGSCRIVSDLMVRDVRTFQADTPLEHICDCLMANHFRRVPILEGDKLVGVISRTDLMPAILAVAGENSN